MTEIVKQHFTVHHSLCMKSARGEVKHSKFKYLHETTTNRRWFYIDGDTIYTEDPDNHGGFGGQHLTFKMEDGTEYTARGPWKSNSDALFECTGIDLRDEHLTWGLCALDCKGGYPSTEYENLVHLDQAPKRGSFDRIPDIANGFANMLKQPIHYYVESSGGSRSACALGTIDTEKL